MASQYERLPSVLSASITKSTYGYPARFHKDVEQIMENYAEELTLEELARRLGYSKFHLSRVVSDTFHCNFRTLLNSYRISAAEELLRSTRKTVLDIAYATGFQNQSSFNRVFLKITGMTPNQFRNSKTEQ